MTAEGPSGLRQTVNRLARKNSDLEAQNQRLIRMVLMQRLKDADIDFSEGLDLLDTYRPTWENGDGYDLRFSPEAVDSWLAARRTTHAPV